MLPDLAQLLAAPPWLLSLVDLSFRITIVLGAAGLAVSLLRRAPAHARHLMWTWALFGVLLLPFAGRVLPTWTLRILPHAAPAPLVEPVDAPPIGDDSGSAFRYASFEPLAAAPREASPAAQLAPTPPLSLDRWLLALWLTGIATVLLKVLFDRAQTWYLSDRAADVDGERHELFLRQVRRLGIQRPVRLVEVGEAALPMTWGIWTTARLEAVMLHELAHVRRHDALTQLLAQLVCAAYWVHPFVWWAARQMRTLREYACDDEVLSHGVRPSRD